MRIPRPVVVPTVLGLLMGGGVAWTTAASAAAPRCLVINAVSAASYTSLQAAQNAAQAGATLWLRGTCTGTTQITKSLTVTGQHRRGFTAPTLEGAGQDSVLKISSGVTLTVNTLAITGGHAVNGGGILANTESSVTLNNVTVSGNTASAVGGGIFSQGNDTLTLNGSTTITGNTSGRRGGGIFNWVGTVTLNDSATITGNTATGRHDGGGIFNLCGTLQRTRGRVFDNKPDNIDSVCA